MKPALTAQATNHLTQATCFSSTLSAIGGFETSPTIAIAVSGGADSMALLLLTHDWVQKHGGKVIGLTVDHGLRPESTQEAQTVCGWCNDRGIEHHILSAQNSIFRIEAKTQDAARRARYGLLTEWCKKNHVLHLLTAHHQGDQVETLFFRLSAGSGIDGLASMPMVSIMNGVRVIRPLIEIKKYELQIFLNKKKQKWIEDLTNRKLHYTRNLIRMKLEGNSHIQSSAHNVAERYGNIRNHMENKLASYLTKSVYIFPGGYGYIDLESFSAMPNEYAKRALSALLQTLNGDEHPPRTYKLQRLYKEILERSIRRRTLGGCQLIYQAKYNRLLVCREPKAMENALALPPHSRAIWDNRFEVKNLDNREFSVRALGADGIKKLGAFRHIIHEKVILSALPSFWRLEELVAAPHIHYRNPDFGHTACAARFFPAKALAAAPFFRLNKVDE